MTTNNQEAEIQNLLDQQEQIIEQRIQQRLQELPPTIEAKLEQAHQQLTFHVENSPLAVIEWDEQFRVKRWSPQAEKIFGWKAEELLNRHWNHWEFVYPEDLEQVNAISSRLLNGEENRNICCNRNYTKQGNLVYCEWYNSVLKNSDGRVISLLSLVQDVTIRETAQQELKRRARQQQVIAELGQYALSQTNLGHLAKKVVTLVGQTLGIKYIEIWELLPNQGTFLLTAGLGLRPRSVGRVTRSNSPQSQPGYTLLVKQPVIVEDLRVETRFSVSGSAFFSNHDIVSGVTVLISGKEKPFGVLGIHSQEQRTFSTDEINFLQAVANIIASGVDRQQAEAELKTLNQDLEIRVADRTTELIFTNEKLQRQVVELKKIESELETKAAQQAIIAELGQKALSETNLVSLINEVVIQIANNLNVEYCKVLEYSLEDCFLTLAIWDEPLKNYILLSHEPLLSLSLNRNQVLDNQEDLKSNLFSCTCKYSQDLEPKELNYGKFNFVNQGICIPIRGQNYQQLGQIEIYGKKNQLFREDEVNYLQSVANILATAIERKQTEVALRFSEERFKITLKNSPIVVFNQDLALRYTWIYNPAGGYEAEAVIGKVDFDIFPVENAIQLTQLKQQVLNTKVGLRKEVTTNIGGDIQCYDLTIDPLWDLEGNIIGITGAALDITDR
ncbi:MAG: PAS domain S-box protein, partial [Planktothrix sp.]